MTGAVRPAASGRSWQFPGSWLAQTTQRRGPGQYANVKRFSASPPVADVDERRTPRVHLRRGGAWPLG